MYSCSFRAVPPIFWTFSGSSTSHTKKHERETSPDKRKLDTQI